MPAGGPVRALEVEKGLWLIVSTVPARDYGEAALARGLQNMDWVGRQAMAHEAVIERFLTARAVLPMQLFTMFTSDERAVEHIASSRSRIVKVLARVERRVEWGVRLTWDEQAARDAGGAQARLASRPRQGGFRRRLPGSKTGSARRESHAVDRRACRSQSRVSRLGQEGD
jgi:hypothetical protein